MSEKRPRSGIAEVAAAAGVSRTTVSMVLNDKGRISEETRERVKRAAQDLNYRPNLRAQRLRSGRSRTVAIYNPVQTSLPRDTQLDFALELSLPVAQACLARGYSLLLIPPLTSSEQVAQFDIDGVIVMDPAENDPYCSAFKAHGAAVVTIGRAPGAVADAVVERRYGGADVMLEHLVECGSRRIVVITTDEAYALRTEMLRFLDEQRLPAGTSVRVERVPAAEGERGGYRVARALLDGPPADRPDAFYAPLSTFAVGVLTAARELGLRIPEDLRIAANFNGHHTMGSDPPMTALDLKLPEMAAVASKLLLDLLDGGGRRTASAPLPEVIPRASTVGDRGLAVRDGRASAKAARIAG